MRSVGVQFFRRWEEQSAVIPATLQNTVDLLNKYKDDNRWLRILVNCRTKGEADFWGQVREVGSDVLIGGEYIQVRLPLNELNTAMFMGGPEIGQMLPRHKDQIDSGLVIRSNEFDLIMVGALKED
jgi:hypothetical protein